MKDIKGTSYFDNNNYNSDKHWYIDTWIDDKSPYFEATAFERKDNKSWDVFFNQFEDENEIDNICGGDSYFTKSFGVFLINSSESEVEKEFRQWVNEKLIPYRNQYYCNFTVAFFEIKH